LNPSRPPGLFPFWLVLVAIGLAALILAGGWALISSSRPARGLLPTATLLITVLPVPSPSPLAASATPEVSPTPMQPTAEGVPTPSGEIKVGDLVQVVGTGVNGLNLRAAPGLEQGVNLLVLDSEVFRVDDGPQDASGFTWWLLVDLQDAGRGGWGVENYLQVVQGN